jgi:hypothetical protein
MMEAGELRTRLKGEGGEGGLKGEFLLIVALVDLELIFFDDGLCAVADGTIRRDD